MRILMILDKFSGQLVDTEFYYREFLLYGKKCKARTGGVIFLEFEEDAIITEKDCVVIVETKRKIYIIQNFYS